MSVLLGAHLVLGWIVAVAYLAPAVWGTKLLIRGYKIDTVMRYLLVIATSLSILEGLIGIGAYFTGTYVPARYQAIGSVYVVTGVPVFYWIFSFRTSNYARLFWLTLICYLSIAAALNVVIPA